MIQRRFISRSRYISAHINIRVSQRRDASALAALAKGAKATSEGMEIQHTPVESDFHEAMVNQCEIARCMCRAEESQPSAAPGLAKRP